MGRPRKWKPGDRGYIAAGTKDAFGLTFSGPIDATVTSIISESQIKITADDGTVYYCSKKDFKPRKAQASRRPAKHIVTEEIKKTAATMAEKRMEEIMSEANKPAFGDVMEKFYSLFKAGEMFESVDGENDWIIKAAEKQLYETIKGGVCWGEAK